MKRAMLAISLLPLLIASSAAAKSGDCFWAQPTDLPIPEANVLYFRAAFTLAKGERLQIAGHYPYARQMSFNVHRAGDNATVAVATDTSLDPSPGSRNPFRAAGRAKANRRAYRLTITEGGEPGPNLVAVPIDASGSFKGVILYRMYLPNKSRPGGGVSLPSAVHVDAKGYELPLTLQCQAPMPIRQVPGPTNVTKGASAYGSTLDWRGALLRAGQPSGGVLINRDNGYAYAVADFAENELFLLAGRSPTHPLTLEGGSPAGAYDVRYWSICVYPHPADRTSRCIADEQLALRPNRKYRILVGPANRRPANAKAKCGINWLDSGTSGSAALLLRHVAPSPKFTATPGRLESDAPASAILGKYEPNGKAITKAAFEALGCPVR